MSDMDFDFGAEFAAFGDDIKGTSYEGDHQMRVVKATPTRTQKGKMQINVRLAFIGGPLGAKGKTIDDRLIWSPESDVAARIFAQNLKALGAPQDWIMSARPTPQQICDQITGTVVEVTLKKDEWNGQPTTRVNYKKTVSSNPLGAGQGGAVASASANQAVSLDEEPTPDPVDLNEATDTDAPAAGKETVDKTTGEVKQPATVGAGAATEDPWAV